ncbi:respiratory nitrate reductase subunit gamma [Allokutzneria sp. NRRL B-24872]|uniref:respiratory nitrate reductase subunit gamma n=1 Tax=Allokutzneria sp. NRRL B-24872 TaxID=1137961 RepID=UPI000A3BAF47|nr:respiratory nitrate reductase subunit gamma [Allokutzneria sp. NRRL B-24872]
MTDVLLWVVAPYLAIVLLVAGTVWRYRYDKFGLSTRSSQLYESRLLRVGSPLFHFGLLMVVGGHVLGLVVPKNLTEFFGVSEEQYHLVSLGMGSLAGLATVTGLGILLWRRVRTPAVRGATTGNDKVMYVVLVCVLLAGLATTVITNGVQGGYDYRSTVSPWFRGVLLLHPDPSLMASAPLSYRVHVLFAMVLFALWPFSRLVHAFSAPVRYLVRPYIVYRSRDERPVERRMSREWQRR